MNRRIIEDIGFSRESIHFNGDVEFHPMTVLSPEQEAMLTEEVNPVPSNIFKKILEKRMRTRKAFKKNPVPHFHETQVVFMRDQTPQVGSVLRAANKGPYRIEKLEDRNVLLTDLATGKTVHSHVQLIRPLEVHETRLLLSKGWDLNLNAQRANMPSSHAGIFDAPMLPFPVKDIIEKEKLHEFPEEGELENIFQVPQDEILAESLVNPTSEDVPVPSAPKPPDRDLERSLFPLRRSPRLIKDTCGLFSAQTDLLQERDLSEEERDLGEEISPCRLNLQREISRQYSESLGYKPTEIGTEKVHCTFETSSQPKKSALRRKRSVSIYLPNAPPYLFTPEREEDSECEFSQ